MQTNQRSIYLDKPLFEKYEEVVSLDYYKRSHEEVLGKTESLLTTRVKFDALPANAEVIEVKHILDFPDRYQGVIFKTKKVSHSFAQKIKFYAVKQSLGIKDSGAVYYQNKEVSEMLDINKIQKSIYENKISTDYELLSEGIVCQITKLKIDKNMKDDSFIKISLTRPELTEDEMDDKHPIEVFMVHQFLVNSKDKINFYFKVSDLKQYPGIEEMYVELLRQPMQDYGYYY